MCCFMEKRLANMLADFEMKLEKEVLEPLNKLSEVWDQIQLACLIIIRSVIVMLTD